MEQLLPHLNKIKVPGARDKVYKDECVFSFDNPESETGLYVSLTSFLGLGLDYVEHYAKRTGNNVFLHIKRERREVPLSQQGDGPESKITRLAIGVEGGFNPANRGKIEFDNSYSIVVVPEFTTIPWPNANLPEKVVQSVNGILQLKSATSLAELETSNTWDGEARVNSKHTENLLQLDTGKKIPPSNWKCEKCDKTDNLWLNLTDGTILCGRKFYDGSGGNNHAIQHFNNTQYPLAVKLGTITNEGKADVFSYAEDDMVNDPKLIDHLLHWGINVMNMKKTEKSMIELEVELNKRTSEWTALQESDGKLKPIYGPGYTGMENLGNSCYLNSVVQMLFATPDFIDRYATGGLQIINSANLENPASDFNLQMAKLGVGLISGKYSRPPPEGSPVDADSPGIAPSMFKTLIGRGHPDFSTKKQQDAQEFFLYMLLLLERHNVNQDNPGECFKFQIEERIQCSSTKKVKYTNRSENILSLNIPLEAVINKEEVSAFELKRAEAEAQKRRLSPDVSVRPRIEFFSCLEVFTQTEIVEQFYSTALKAKTTGRKTTRIATFPDYLVIQLKKFTLREDWVPIKLDVAVEMPDILDLTNLRATGPQPDEESLPELVGNLPAPAMDEDVLFQLMQMGFPAEACKRAVFFTRNSGLEPATSWLMEHVSDSNFADPFIPPGTEAASFTPNKAALEYLKGCGFTYEQVVKALKATDNNLDRAIDWIFSHPIEDDNPLSPPPREFRDGNGQYKLIAFVSHMGTSSMVGHYVVHILKENRWTIFNDSKVALSEHPPKELGYLYLYERI